MSSFTKKAFDSTKGRGTPGLRDDLRKHERQQAQTYRQFGGTGPAPGLTTRDREDAVRDYQISDEQRREQAAGNLGQLSMEIDARRGAVSDVISDSQEAVEKANRLARQQQLNMGREHDLQLRTTEQQTEDKLRNIGFTEYRNQTQRNDLMDEAYERGALDEELFEAGIDGKIRQQDIDFYYKKISQDLENAFDMWKVRHKAEADKYFERAQANAENMGSVIEGITQTILGGIFG